MAVLSIRLGRKPTRAGLLASALFAFLAIGRAAPTPDGIRIQVKDVDSTALLQQVADLTKREVIVAPRHGPPRISLAVELNSEIDPLAFIADRIGEPIESRGSISVAGTLCPVRATYTGKALQERITMNFQRISLDALFAIFKDVGVEFMPSLPTSSDRRSIAIRVKDRPLGEVLAVLATPSPSDSCVRSRKGNAQAPAQMHIDGNYCPYRSANKDGTRRYCQPLEAFGLHALLPKGFVRIGTRYTALIEAPNGLTYSAMAGDYLGRDFGRVHAVAPEGIDLVELVPDDDARYEARSRVLAFDVRPPPTTRADHLSYMDASSPLAKYEEALQALLGAEVFRKHMTDWCSRLYPELSESLQANLARWRERNQAVLSEIDRHLVALDIRDELDLVPPDRRIGASHRTYKASLLHGLEVFGLDGRSANAEQVCNGIKESKNLGPEDLNAGRAELLARLRQCHEHGTCLNLPQP